MPLRSGSDADRPSAPRRESGRKMWLQPEPRPKADPDTVRWAKQYAPIPLRSNLPERRPVPESGLPAGLVAVAGERAAELERWHRQRTGRSEQLPEKIPIYE